MSNIPGSGRSRTPAFIGRLERPYTPSDDKEDRSDQKDWILLVSNFVSNHVTIPIKNALCLSEWRSLPIHIHINKQSYKILNVFEDIEFKYLNYNIRDFYDMYAKSDKIVYFKCLSIEEYNRRYLSLRESVFACLELLYF